MYFLYFHLFTIICILLLVWGFAKPSRVYQYPFFMGVTFFAFMRPQMVALSNDLLFTQPSALARTFFMACLCIAMCWFGYKLGPNQKLMEIFDHSISDQKLFNAAILLTAVGYFFNILLSRTTIQTSDNSNWTGPATILLFFSQVLYPGFAIFLLLVLKKFTVKKLVFTLIAGYPLFLPVITAGRRQPAMTLMAIIGLSFWYMRRYVPPRWLVLLLVLAFAYLIPVIGELRGVFWKLLFAGEWQVLITYSQQSFEHLLSGDILELRNAVLLMEAVAKTGNYGFGTGFWDSLIFQYIPGQIVGYGLKDSLQFRLSAFNPLWASKALEYYYAYQVPLGSTFTGIGDSFVEFGYAGCLLFAGIGYLFKTLWMSSNERKSIPAMLLYMSLLSPSMISITHRFGRFVQEAPLQIITVVIVTHYASTAIQKKKKQAIRVYRNRNGIINTLTTPR